MLKITEVNADDIPRQSTGRPVTTNYKKLRSSKDGRRELKERGYIVRKNPPKPGTRKRTGRFVTGQFVAWDGEGVTDASGKHHYILLANSTGSYLHSEFNSELQGLPTVECFEFLLDEAARTPNAFHVIYGGGYDFNKILKDFVHSPMRLRKLWDTSQSFWKNYHVEWVRGKWLKIRCMRTNRRITLYDVISFFQMSFVSTLKAWEIQVDNLEEIERMKQERAVFSVENFPEILHYCGLEMAALVRLMERFRDNHLAAGLPVLTGLYGPGAIANGLLKRHSIKRHMVTDKDVTNAATYAYAAGRIERLRYGNHEGPIRIYDINSAYPYAISQFPSLVGGWRHYSGNAPDVVPMSVYHVRLFNSEQYASPLFYRKGVAKSRPIFFPNPKGNSYIESWIWTPEYELLVELGFPFATIEAYIFDGDLSSRPFDWVQDMYHQRLEWKRDNNPAEKNLKLALNSLYGKFVQQAGYQRNCEIPKWHQLEWGGYATSYTRAAIYRAMHSVGFRNVVACETDSVIIAGEELPNVKLGDQLGEWGVTEYEGITFVQSGVYWLKKEGEWLDKYSKRRGYLPGTLDRGSVMQAWNGNPYGDDTIYQLQKFLTVIGRSNQFLTLGHCYRPGQTLIGWGDWLSGPKKLSLWKTNKRAIVRSSSPSEGLLDTEDRTDFNGWSSPYSLEWGDQEGD